MDLSVSYVPPHQPLHIETDIKYLKSVGCTDVLCALQENHFHWLPGAVRYSAQIAGDNGLLPRAVVWGFANTSGGGRCSVVMLRYPEIWRCDEHGRPYLSDTEYGPQACYNNPKTVELYSDYVSQLCQAGFAEIMIDEPSPQKCFCGLCREKFHDLYHCDLVQAAGTGNFKDFQQRCVIDFAVKSSKAIKNVNSKLRVSIAIMPIDRPLFEPVAAIRDIDVFGIDPYWLRPVNELTLESAIEVSKDARDIARKNKKRFELYLGCFGIAGGLEEKIYSEGKMLVECAEPDILTTWSYRGGLGLRREPEECEHPELAWAGVVRLYRELSRKG
jgi:hypothetical protein